MLRSAVVAVCASGYAAIAAVPAVANVVTFTDIPATTIESPLWVEDGISVVGTGSLFGYFSIPDSLHLDGMSPYSNIVDFTMASVFDAQGFDIIPVEVGADHSERCVGAVCGLPFMNLMVEGYSGANLVAILGLWTGGLPFTLPLPDTFSGLTRLRLSMLFATDCMDQPCTHINIDNVRLDPVPLPAALPLFAGSLLVLGAGGCWRRRGRRGSPGQQVSAP
jgi:hypothetical protein